MIPKDFRGRAARLADVDLPRVGHMLGVGEDEIHAVLDVEARGSGFDQRGRPTMLFEPHLFWRELGGSVGKRTRAAAAGLAYEKWGTNPYPADSYPRLTLAMAVDETAALVARMTVAPSAARAAAYDRLVRALIAAGVWARLDALYILAAHDAQAARLNWRAAAYDLTAVGGMTFAPQRGYQGDGSTGYLSSGFNPTTAQAPLFAQNDAHMGLWSLTDGIAAAHDMGAGNSSLAMLATTTTFQARGNSGAASGASQIGAGHLMWSRADASNVARYRDGAAHSTAAQASVALSNYAFRVGGYLTSTASYSARQIAAAHWGAALDATQTKALYNALRRYLTGAGAL